MSKDSGKKNSSSDVIMWWKHPSQQCCGALGLQLVLERRAHFRALQRRASLAGSLQRTGQVPGLGVGGCGLCSCPPCMRCAHLFVGCQRRAGAWLTPCLPTRPWVLPLAMCPRCGPDREAVLSQGPLPRVEGAPHPRHCLAFMGVWGLSKERGASRAAHESSALPPSEAVGSSLASLN